MNDSWTTYLNHGWIISALAPTECLTDIPLILLHGLSGDEHSIKPLVQNFKRTRWLISPRGLISVEEGGYAWAPAKTRNQAGFTPSVEAFIREWPAIRNFLKIEQVNADLLGFSQGAAYASMLLLAAPGWIRDIAMLSGFVPAIDSPSNTPALEGHRVFISHGSADDVVPFSDSQRSVEFFNTLGAKVTFCKSNTRHKIDAYCLKQLESFLGKSISDSGKL